MKSCKAAIVCGAVFSASILGGCERMRTVTATDVTPRKMLRSDVVGCWMLSHESGRNSALAEDWAPAIVRLDTTSLGATAVGRRLAVRLDSAQVPMPPGFETGITGATDWAADESGDWVRITFNSALFGSHWSLRIPPSRSRNDTVRGTSQRFTDVPDERHSSRDVRAVRVPCRVPAGTPGHF